MVIAFQGGGPFDFRIAKGVLHHACGSSRLGVVDGLDIASFFSGMRNISEFPTMHFVPTSSAR